MTAKNVLARTRLPPLPTIRDIIKLYNLRALRQLSQNFLLDEHLNNKIVQCSGNITNSEICEVGPGPGNITRSILNNGARKIYVIEKDRRFIPILQLLQEASEGKMDLIIGDVMNFNMEKLFTEEKARAWTDEHPELQIIGNLPFNVSTPLIIRWLHAISERRNAWRYGRVRMTLTFQLEVAERMAAPILTRQRCRLSVMCQNWCRVEHRFTIPGHAFLPKPQVDVGVVHLKPHINPIIPLPFKLVEKVVQALFSFRQKKSIRGIETLFPKNMRNERGLQMYSKADLNPETRSFQFTVPEIGRLCQAYQDILKEDPNLSSYDLHKNKDDDNWLQKEEEQLEEIRKWRENQNMTNDLIDREGKVI